MNTNVSISKEIKRQVDDYINKSGVSAEQFLKELAKAYNMEVSVCKEDFIGNFNDYCDSFIA